MDVIDTLTNIANTKLITVDTLRYCFHKDKVPYKVDGTPCRPNSKEDFVTFNELLDAPNIEQYSGVGISVQASNVCAIDVDHCFEEPFNFASIDERGKYIYEKFKNLAYIEFSFSGCGMRVLFSQPNIPNYKDLYYTKNSVVNIEFYQPSGSARYVTVTGRPLANNQIKAETDFVDVIIEFLNKYMLLPKKTYNKPKSTIANDKTFEQLMKDVKIHLFRYSHFQLMWFNDRREYNIGRDYQGTGESEHDYALLQYIYNNFTQDVEMCKKIFEESEYFKTKDKKHVDKWNRSNFRYYYFIFDRL